MDKMLNEIFRRVLSLEERVEILEELLNKNGLTVEEDVQKVTRTISRQYVIDKLRKKNELVTVDKAKGSDVEDLIIKASKNGINYKIKAVFKHSKSHSDYPNGWHNISESEILDEDILFYIFNLFHQGTYFTFLFSKVELLSFIVNKHKNSNNIYHFNFKILDDGSYEVRDTEQKADQYLNNWSILNQFIN
ncbi:hypothetical protein JCM19047_2503 [Bacillus sp. JCM 19047]|nr:hypothetical protein JCM19047_2503 [Bacillus sp. JCM 19047]